MNEMNLIINIGIYKTLGLVAVVVAGSWYLSHRLTKTDTKVDNVEKQITNLTGRVDKVVGSSSPISLLEKGKVILEDSGLKNFIDNKKEELMKNCQDKKKIKTSYDAQEISFSFFDDYKFEKSFEDKLKQSAYKNGVSMNMIRRIAGIYFRDICLDYHNLKIDDIGKQENKSE
jgi:hypothetical protein